jgi:DNA polymerase-3 subunit delta'
MARAPREQEIEVFPEADCLEGFAHPRFTERLFGQGEAEAQLGEGLAGGRLHHAWMLVGPEGVGKATLAYRFAKRALHAEDGHGGLFGDAAQPTTLDVDPATPAARLVEALSHPDLLVLRRPYDIRNKRFKTAITVDEVRRLRGFLGHRASGRAHKVVIVDSADELNVNAANALLKALEEPPERVVFLLICSMPGRLLATIRSRCRLLMLQPLGHEDLEAAARQALAAAELDTPGAEDWPALMTAAGGSVRRLLSLVGDDAAGLARRVDDLLDHAARGNWARVHELADALSGVQASAAFDAFVELLTVRLAGIIRAAATGEGEAGDVEAARRLRVGDDLASWAELWETLVREKALQGTLNLDRKAFLLEAARRLGRLSGRG